MVNFLVELSLATLCLTTIGLHFARKNRNEALLYALQSIAVVGILGASLLEHLSTGVIVIAALTLIVKVILAPIFFIRLIKRHQIKSGARTNVSVPITLAVTVGLLALARSEVFAPLANLAPEHKTYLILALAAMLNSIWLMVNRRGALSQVVGILSLENCIVAFAVLAGLEQSAVLQAGVIFDISVWLIVAVTMVSFVYKTTGTLDISQMKELKLR